ncbi:MAG: hypothetical protein R3C24_19705 [Cyanobacteriota/Melainabacteria group bacterium]
MSPVIIRWSLQPVVQKTVIQESVMRFTRQSPNQLYVLAASVDYDAGGSFFA